MNSARFERMIGIPEDEYPVYAFQIITESLQSSSE